MTADLAGIRITRSIIIKIRMSSETNLIHVQSIEGMMKIRDGLKRNGTRIHFVPTMGALHRGHEALIQEAMKPLVPKFNGPIDLSRSVNKKDQDQDQDGSLDQVVVVSIFVNPVQFNNPRDLINYPKPIEEDIEICQKLGVHYLFNPKTEDMYPNGHEEGVICTVQGNFFIQYQMEGMSRPGHFTGMLTVVNKLFNIICPDEAFFGEKDYQQLLLVQRMVQDLNMAVTIKPVPTIREPDGLPLSSRNIRIQKDDRPLAAMMSEILHRIKNELEHKFDSWLANITGDENQYVALLPMVNVLLNPCNDSKISDGFMRSIDYIELRCAKDLGNIEYVSQTRSFDCNNNCIRKKALRPSDKPYSLSCRLLAAVEVGGVRLLDNVEVILNQDITTPSI